MALSQRLEIRQSHALVMTPQLMQAIKLLQLSNLDLATYVENEIEKNPLLERSEADEERRPGERESPEDAAVAERVNGGDTDTGDGADGRAGPDLDDGAAGDADAGASRTNAEV